MRVPLRAPLTKMQQACVLMLANGHNTIAVAEKLGVGYKAVRFHINAAAKKIPGDLPAQMRVVAWVRGATLEVLEGTHTNEHLDELVKKTA